MELVLEWGMVLEPKALAEQIARIAILDEPLRRRLYFFVSGRGHEVSRDQAAKALRVSRALVAFHLDKLVEGGLLETTYRRISGKSGPGAGRPAKLYRVSQQQLALSLPERRYELAAQLLLQAVARVPREGIHEALHQVAFGWGHRLGSEARARARPAITSERLFKEATEVLSQCGFEPQWDARGHVALQNCPFEALATEHRDVVCRMNLALMEGLLDGLGLDATSAKLDPQPGMCCVILGLDPGQRPTNRRPRSG